jgi:hypothetical protein
MSDGAGGGGSYHVVSQGESVESIATENGHFWETLWNDPNNADLKKLRKDPHILFPGDQVYVPPLRPRQENAPTTKRTTFKRKGIPSKLKVRFLDDGKPRAGKAYTLTVDDGPPIQGTTDGDGVLTQPVPPRAEQAVVLFDGDTPDLAFTFSLRWLDPVDTPSGQRERLRNLGYPAGPPNDEADLPLSGAIARFQEQNGLPATGEADDKTQKKLAEVHKC